MKLSAAVSEAELHEDGINGYKIILCVYLCVYVTVNCAIRKSKTEDENQSATRPHCCL